MTKLPAAFDLCVIGGPGGFYAGQAKHKRGGGWERRITDHRRGKGQRRAQQLLAGGAPAHCLGTVQGEQRYINVLEARAWDVRVARGWKPVHRRPNDRAGWNESPGNHTSRTHTAVVHYRLPTARESARGGRLVAGVMVYGERSFDEVPERVGRDVAAPLR